MAGLIRGSSGVEGRDGEGLIARRARSSLKLLARTLTPAAEQHRRVVLIFGCQRSGTTMLQQTLLDRSWRVFILEEHDRRLIGDEPDPLETAWEEHGVVLARIHRLPFEVVAVKPLVESDRAAGLIDTAGNARAIWMLRHYLDVARSNLRRFGLENAHRDLEAFRSPDRSNWRCRGATEATRRTVVELLDGGLEPLDAAALFWWTRNQLYFDQGLDRHDGVRVLRYEHVRNEPQAVIGSLSRYIDISLSVRAATRRVRAPRSSSPTAQLHPKVAALCDEMLESFDGCREL